MDSSSATERTSADVKPTADMAVKSSMSSPSDSRPGSSHSHGAPEIAKEAELAPKKANLEDHYLHGFDVVLVLIPLTLAFFLLMLDMSILATAIPAITSEFNSLLDIGWYGGAYTLTASAFMPLSGKVYNYFSTKWTFLTFFFIFEVGSAICGAAQNSGMLIAGRAIAGIGSAGIINGCFTVLAASMAPKTQTVVMGVNVGLGQLGVAMGPLIGGAFTDRVTWRWCFYINLPIGAIVGGVMAFMAIPENRVKPPFMTVIRSNMWKSLDLMGFALIAPAASMFFVALQFGGNQYEWGSSVVIGLFVGAFVSFVLFLIWEYRVGDEAMVPFSMLRQRIIYSAAGMTFCFYGAQFVGSYYLPIYFQSVKDDTALDSGVHILPTILAQVIFSMLAGGLTSALGFYWPWAIGGNIFASIGYGLLTTLRPDTSIARWIGFQIVLGVGLGGAGSSAFIAIQNRIPAAHIPTAISIVNFCGNLGGAVFLLVAQTTFSQELRKQLAVLVPDVNAEIILGVGARGFRQLVGKVLTEEQLVGVISSYSASINRLMYVGLGLGIAAIGFASGLGFIDIRKQNVNKVEGDEKAVAPLAMA